MKAFFYYLDRETARIDSLIEKVERQRAVITAAVTERIVVKEFNTEGNNAER